mmetsp:Transcript_113067/g.365178  ORF Transcript_113067/g.365178 Transcript_113067/m.365178 type:complete len:243 (+) Transcript_113067:399-1127(+)
MLASGGRAAAQNAEAGTMAGSRLPSQQSSSSRLGRSACVAYLVSTHPASRRSMTSRSRHRTRFGTAGSKVRPRMCQKTSCSCPCSGQVSSSKQGPTTLRRAARRSKLSEVIGAWRSSPVHAKKSSGRSMLRVSSSPKKRMFPRACVLRKAWASISAPSSSMLLLPVADSEGASKERWKRCQQRLRSLCLNAKLPSPKSTTRYAQRSAYMPEKLGWAVASAKMACASISTCASVWMPQSQSFS